MADVKQCIDFVLHQEDATMSGAVTRTHGDRGGATRYGITERWHPELIASGFFDAEKMPAGEAVPLAEQAYQTQYVREISLDQIESQGIAERFLSFAVNEGPREATTLIQRALVASGQQLDIDGRVGPKTLAAINDTLPEVLLANLRIVQEMFYQHIAAIRPDQEPFLHGWLNRVAA